MGRAIVMSVAKELSVWIEDTLPIYDATDLTKGGDLAQIGLENERYALRIARAGKQILTK